MDSLQHYDVKAGMERAHAPMVGINSTMRPTNVVANRKYLPRYELLPLPEGVGHFPQVEAPQAFNSLLERAITLLGRRCGRGAGSAGNSAGPGWCAVAGGMERRAPVRTPRRR